MEGSASAIDLGLSLRTLTDANRRESPKIIYLAEQPMLSTAEPVELSQQTTSRQLGALRKTGLFINTPEGPQQVFAVNTEGFAVLRSYLDGVWPEQFADLKPLTESGKWKAMAGTGGELGAVLDTPCQNRNHTSSLRSRKNGRIR
ncbi:ArsR/SmtB family transcription factor [Glutamicibacter halophytocola]|uniref:ArsR/SmtB family transcription factor n=1 Tax=Glutamicibacter halophytocola TaxID=1933880 RepID=UPI00096B1DE8|nr:hypothetical protein [Glutamicibacter halophytocola]